MSTAIAIAIVVGGSILIALYVFGLLVEIVCALLDRLTLRHARRNRVTVFGDNVPLRGSYTPAPHCDVQKAHDAYVRQNP